MAIEEKARGTSLGWGPREAPLHEEQLGFPNCPYCCLLYHSLVGHANPGKLAVCPQNAERCGILRRFREQRTAICWWSFVLCEGSVLSPWTLRSCSGEASTADR